MNIVRDNFENGITLLSADPESSSALKEPFGEAS